ncbi:MAG: hypothetical protein JWP43_1436 [Ramlibacter sp.]|nr:hypothetical protein [Ramlibacter sp.]
MNNVSRRMLAMALIAGLGASGASAQSACSSDGVPRPAALAERFISADCEACWRDAGTATLRPGELAVDWIVPGRAGQDAPLSVAASREALARLKELGPTDPTTAATSRLTAASGEHKLRVAHGPAFKGYMGASIELKPGSGGPWHAWLLLVETLPAGSDGSPVARNLVRNALQLEWHAAIGISNQRSTRLSESRAMDIPKGAHPDRLRVVGWVEDVRGRVVAAAQSRC